MNLERILAEPVKLRCAKMAAIQKIGLCKPSLPCGCCVCCGCCLIVPWLMFIIMSIMIAAAKPAWCSNPPPKGAAKDLRPGVYSEDSSVDWSSVAGGWNKACGDIPSDFSAEAAKYTQETGGQQLITDDSGFKSNPWTPLMFKKVSVTSVGPSESAPFGRRPNAVKTMTSIGVVNLFFMPTATAEVALWMDLQYEVCAYFKNPSGLPQFRLYKTTKSPLGVSDPFVQEFVSSEGGDPKKVSYDAISPGYNDDSDTIPGKARFSVAESTGCGEWSGAVTSLIVLITVAIIVFTASFVFVRTKAKKLIADAPA